MTLGLAACGADSEPVSAPAPAGVSNAFMARALVDASNAGHVHNEVQREILSALLEERDRIGRVTPEALEGLAMAACRRAMEAALSRSGECGQIREALRHRGSNNFVAPPPLASVSSEYLDFMDDIEDAAAAGPSAAAVAAATDAIVASAQATLTDTLEVYSVTLAATVTDSSAVYWEAEWDTWETAAYNCESAQYEEHPACVGPFEISGPDVPFDGPVFDAWYDWLCNERCRRVVGADAAAAIGAAVYNWVAGPAGAASVVALAAGGSATQATLEVFDMLNPN
jgi:hypothetical protein